LDGRAAQVLAHVLLFREGAASRQTGRYADVIPPDYSVDLPGLPERALHLPQVAPGKSSARLMAANTRVSVWKAARPRGQAPIPSISRSSKESARCNYGRSVRNIRWQRSFHILSWHVAY